MFERVEEVMCRLRYDLGFDWLIVFVVNKIDFVCNWKVILEGMFSFWYIGIVCNILEVILVNFLKFI